MQAPSKKIILMIFTSLVVVGAVGVNKFWPNAQAAPLVTPSYSAPAIAKADAESGLIDGTAFLQNIGTTSAATSTDNTPATPSREIARALFANTAYMESSSGGNAIDDMGKAALVQNAVNQIQQAFKYKQYAQALDGTISNQNAQTIKMYASSFAEHQVGMVYLMQNNVLRIENDLSVLGDIYAKQAEDLYTLKVPKELAEAHLAIVNNFSKSAAAFYAFQSHKDDPLIVPIAMREYQVASVEQEALLRQVAQFISSNGIIFTSDEVGGYWNAFQ